MGYLRVIGEYGIVAVVYGQKQFAMIANFLPNVPF
jgi:hypothetical protein